MPQPPRPLSGLQGPPPPRPLPASLRPGSRPPIGSAPCQSKVTPAFAAPRWGKRLSLKASPVSHWAAEEAKPRPFSLVPHWVATAIPGFDWSARLPLSCSTRLSLSVLDGISTLGLRREISGEPALRQFSLAPGAIIHISSFCQLVSFSVTRLCEDEDISIG